MDSKQIEDLGLDKDLLATLKFGDDPELELKIMPLGIPSLDRILGGGLRQGHTALVVGEWSSGKTFFTQQAIKAAQREGLTSYFIDIERTYSPLWFAKSGVDVKELVVSRPKSGEQAADIVEALIKARSGIIVLDSIAALAPAEELAKDASEEARMGAKAKLMDRMLRMCMNDNISSIILLVNQYRANLGADSRWKPTTLPGGRAQDFDVWQKIVVKRDGWLTKKVGKDEKRIGYKMEFLIEKNKQAAPYQSTSIPFLWEDGLQLTESVVDVALELGIIEMRGGGNFYMNDERFDVRGREAFIKLVEEDPELRKKLEDGIRN